MTRIAITGASGHYGRIVIDTLIAAGRAQDLILMTRRPERLADYAAQGCTVRQGDYDQPDTLAPAFAGAERLLLISGTRVGARVVQHKAAIDAAVAAGVGHLVYTSFIGIDDPANPAEVRHDHIETERLIKASGIGWTMLRDAHYADSMIVMAGPGVMASRQWISNAGDGREAMVWREDCALCAAVVLTGEGHQGQFYALNDYLRPVQAIFLTAETMDGKMFTGMHGTIPGTWTRFSLDLLANNLIPQNFPLLHVAPNGIVPSGLFLTDHERWTAAAPAVGP